MVHKIEVINQRPSWKSIEMKNIIIKLLLVSLLAACSQQPLIHNNVSYIQGGYAEEVVMQMDEDLIGQCGIDLSNIQVSLISPTIDAKLVDGRLVSGKVVERWNVRDCEKQNLQYIVTLKGNTTGMNEINVIRQTKHMASNS
jgi:hypothetical protein